MDQTISRDTLYLTYNILNTGTGLLYLGNSDFVVNIDPLKFDLSTASIKEGGVFNNNAYYSSFSLSSGTTPAPVYLRLTINKSAQLTFPPAVPTTKTQIAKVALKIIGTGATSIAWRTTTPSTLVKDWGGFDITTFGTFSDPAPLGALCDPTIAVNLTVSPNDSICRGDSVLFTAKVSQVYDKIDFYLNSTIVKSGTTNTYKLLNPSNGDKVHAVVTRETCSSSSNIITLQVDDIQVDLGVDEPICDRPLELDAGTFPSGIKYLWNTGATTQKITVSSPGTYAVRVYRPGGCSDSDTIKIGTEDPMGTPFVSTTGVTATSITFSWNSDPNADLYEFSLDSLLWTVDGDFKQTISSLAPNTTICAWVRAINGCDTVTSKKVCATTNAICSITYTKTKDTAVCVSPYTITLNVSNINPPSWKISWMGGAFSRVSNFTYSNNVDATVYFKVQDSTLAGCFKADSIKINYVPVTNTGWNGLKSSYCTASYSSILTPNESGGIFTGPGVAYNSSTNQWYFKPSLAGAGTHTVTYTICGQSLSKITIVEPAPCVSSVVSDSTSSAISSPQGLFTDCVGQIYVTNAKHDVISLIDTLGNARVIVGDSTFPGGYVDGHISVARIDDPIGITVGPDGAVYFIDGGSHTIRMLKNDVVSTIAGSFGAGNVPAGTGTVAGASAKFNKPFGITFNSTYTKLFISDQGNGKIREIDISTSNYNVRTIAGGGASNVTSFSGVTAFNAKLYKASHLSADGRYIYVSDENAQTVVVYEFLTGLVRLYAGLFNQIGNNEGFTDVAKFNYPSGVSVSCNGDLYVVDKGNHSIKLVDPNTYVPQRYVSNFAGGNSPTGAGDVDGDPATARFNTPQAVSVFVKGFIDIADTGNDKIKRLSIADYSQRPWASLDSDFTYCIYDTPDTLKPSCGGVYTGPGIVNNGGIVSFSPAVAGPGTHTLAYTYTTGYCVESSTQQVTVYGKPNPILSPPSSLVCENEFGIYQLDAGGGFSSYTWYKNNAVDPSSIVRYYTLNTTGNYVVKVTNSGGCIGADTIDIISKPVTQVTISSLEDTLCYGGSTVLTASPSGLLTYFWNTGGVSSSINAIATGDYVVTVTAVNGCVDRDTFRLIEKNAPSICMNVTTLSGADLGYGQYNVSTLAGTGLVGATNGKGNVASFRGLWDVYFDKSGQYLYVTEEASAPDLGNYIRRIKLIDTLVSAFAGAASSGSFLDSTTLASAQFNHPYGIIQFSNGKFAVADNNNHVIRGIDTVANYVLTRAGYPMQTGIRDGRDTSARFNSPFDMTIDAFNNVYVADYGNHKIRRIRYADRFVSTIAGDTSAIPSSGIVNGTSYDAKFSSPYGIEFDVEGNLYVTDATGNTLRKITMDTAVSTLATGFSNPANIVIDKIGTIYVSDIGSNSIKKVSKNGTITTIANGFNNPKGITINQETGILYVADSGNNIIKSLNQNKAIVICENDTVKIDASCSNVQSYLWSPSAGLSSTAIANPLAFPVVTTKYYVRITDRFGCTNTDSITIQVNPKPVANAGSDKTICSLDSVQIGVAPLLNHKYLWNPSISPLKDTLSDPYVKPLLTTNYIVTVTNKATGCKNKDTVRVNVITRPVADAGPDSVQICLSDSIAIGTVGVSYNYYAWMPNIYLSDDSVATPKSSPPSAQKYILTVTSKSLAGCSSRDSIKIKLNAEPIANFIISGASCAADTTQFNNTSSITEGSMIYSWKFGDGSFVSSVVNPKHFYGGTGPYEVVLTATSDKGCIDYDTLNLTPFAQPVANFNYTIPCSGPVSFDGISSGTITSNSWMFGDGNTGTGDPVTHTYSSKGNYTVTLIVTDINTCKDTMVKDLPLFSLLVNAGTDKIICIGDTTELKAIASGGNSANYSFAWSGPSLISNTGSDVKAVPLIAGSPHTYTVTVSDGSCTNTDNVIITVTPLPVVDAGPVSIGVCEGKSTTIGGSPTASSMSGIQSVSWSPNTWLDLTNKANPLSTPLLDTSYVVTVLDNNGCLNRDTIEILINPLPNVTIAQSKQKGCTGTDVTLSVNMSNSANSVAWKDAANNNLGSGLTTNVNTKGTYEAIIINPVTGCSDSASLVVDFIDPPDSIAITAPNDNCINEPIILAGNAVGDSLNYRWTTNGLGAFSDKAISSTLYTPDLADVTPVNFMLTVWNSCDTLTATDNVLLNPAPSASFNYTPLLNMAYDSVSFVNTSDTLLYNINQWIWNFNDGSTTDNNFHPTHIFLNPGIFNVAFTVTNNFGCSYTATVPVEIKDMHIVYVPSVFSPFASNSENKTCKVYGLKVSPDGFNFSVYNRWGELIYESSDFDHMNQTGWDGTNRSKELQSMGVYTYVVKAKWLDGKPIEKTGTITIIR